MRVAFLWVAAYLPRFFPPMKKSALAAFASLALLPVFPACDSHPWEDTKDGKKGSQHMFKPHGGHQEGGDHGADKGGHDAKKPADADH